MSQDMKRWFAVPNNNDDTLDCDETYFGDLLTEHPRQGPLQWQASIFEVMPVTEHDRVVAELRAEVAKALKRVFDRQVGYMVSANAFRVLAEEIKKYDPSFVLPNGFARRKFVADRNDQIQELKETIARQARVIEKLREQRNTVIKAANQDGLEYGNPKNWDKELEAIGKGEK